MVTTELKSSGISPAKDLKVSKWEVFAERAGVWGDADFTHKGFVDHINTTKDTTDYLWYTTRLVHCYFAILYNKQTF